MFSLLSFVYFLYLSIHCTLYTTYTPSCHKCTLSLSPLLAFEPLRLHPISPPSSAGSGLQDGLKLSGHADILLLLTDGALDGGRQAPGVPGEDESVAVLAAAVVLQGAAGVGDGVVFVVGVDHPVVVAWLDRKGAFRECEAETRRYERDVRGMCVRTADLHWTGSWPAPGSS